MVSVAQEDNCNRYNIYWSNLFFFRMEIHYQSCLRQEFEFVVVVPLVVRVRQKLSRFQWLLVETVVVVVPVFLLVLPVVEAASWMAHQNSYSLWPWLEPHYRGFEKRPAPYTPKVSIRSYSLTYLSIQCRSGGSSSRICGFGYCLQKPSHPTARSYSGIYYMSTFLFYI